MHCLSGYRRYIRLHHYINLCFRHIGKGGSALSFDEWLAQKEAIEARRREVKRLIKEKKALEEEDRLAATNRVKQIATVLN